MHQLSLLDQVPRCFGKHVVEERRGVRWTMSFDFGHRSPNLIENFSFEKLVVGGREQPAPEQMAREPLQGISLCPNVYLVGGAVAAGVVARRVRRHAVREKLQERGAPGLTRAGQRLGKGQVN